MAPIKVLFVVNSLCVGGAEKQVVSLFNRLDGEACEASLLCLKHDDALLPQISDERRSRVLPALGVSRGLQWSAVQQLADVIDQQGIDVLLCTNMYALLYGWLARRRCARRHQLRLVEVFHSTDVASRKEALSMLLYRRLLRQVDLLVYVCHGQAEYWRRRGLRARQDMVIYNGIDSGRFADHWTADDKRALREAHGFGAGDTVVGLCAVMRPEKAHGDLLQALALLRREGLAACGLLIGDGPERPRIEREAAELGLAGQIAITGFLPDVRPAVAACDVMVLASHTVETFSIAALEAMALGKPMVMTDIGGAPEQVTPGENGLLYPAGDVAALARCLRRMTDATRRDEMGRQAARRVRDAFDVDRMAHSYALALRALMDGQPVRSDARHQAAPATLGRAALPAL